MARTIQGNRLGRSAVIEMKSAALSGDFGMKMLRAKFPEIADEMLAKLGTYTRGPRMGQPRGYIHWEKIIEGGFDYRCSRRCVVRPGTQEWRVLDSADSTNGKDIGSEVVRAKMAAEQADKEAKWDAMTEREKLIDRAAKARRTAHKELKDGDPEEFRYFMGRARRHIKAARAA